MYTYMHIRICNGLVYVMFVDQMYTIIFIGIEYYVEPQIET